MTVCTACPRKCRVDRSKKQGACGMSNQITVARAALHFWEEPCISGEKGSGTVFFSGCALQCKYCQNVKISHDRFGKEINVPALVHIFESLVEQGAHNLNLVSPTHFAPQIADALRVYKSPVPVVYNTSGYETVDTIKSLEGLVDVYLPDLKYFDAAVSKKYSDAADYFQYASLAVLEMQRQVGTLRVDLDGMAERGMLIRHLVLPGNISQTVKILGWIRDNLPLNTAISLMSQYTPCGEALETPPLNRPLNAREYDKAVHAMLDLGFENGYIQELDSCAEGFIPSFELQGIL